MRTSIVLQGILSPKWESRFQGMQFSYADGKTYMVGEVLDNAALHGILNQIRNLNLNIIFLTNEYQS